MPSSRMIVPDRRPSVQRHARAAKFLHRLLVLGKMRQTHATQDVRRLSELDVVVADDLYTVAPRIEEIEKLTGQRVHPGLGQSPADGLFVIDNESEMTAVVGGLGAALLKS